MKTNLITHIVLSLGVILLYNSITISQANSQDEIQKEKLHYIAYCMCKIQEEHNEMMETYNYWQNDSLLTSERKTIFNTFDGIEIHDIITDYESYLNNNLDAIMHVVAIDIPWDDYYLFKGYRIGYHQNRIYFISLNKQGGIYLLKNFWRDDFENLVSKIFHRDNYEDNIYNIAKLYNIINNNSSKVIVIDKANICEFQQYNNDLHSGIIEKTGDEINVEICLLNTEVNLISKFRFIIKGNGNINILN